VPYRVVHCSPCFYPALHKNSGSLDYASLVDPGRTRGLDRDGYFACSLVVAGICLVENVSKEVSRTCTKFAKLANPSLVCSFCHYCCALWTISLMYLSITYSVLFSDFLGVSLLVDSISHPNLTEQQREPSLDFFIHTKPNRPRVGV
jgi:hypothetical protein